MRGHPSIPTFAQALPRASCKPQLLNRELGQLRSRPPDVHERLQSRNGCFCTLKHQLSVPKPRQGLATMGPEVALHLWVDQVSKTNMLEQIVLGDVAAQPRRFRIRNLMKKLKCEHSLYRRVAAAIRAASVRTVALSLSN